MEIGAAVEKVYQSPTLSLPHENLYFHLIIANGATTRNATFLYSAQSIILNQHSADDCSRSEVFSRAPHRLHSTSGLNAPAPHTHHPAFDQPPPSRLSAPIPLPQLICEHARSNDIDPLILDILTRHESGFDPTAVSPVGARGLMQLMPDTAASLGVTDIDDPYQNVGAGTRYLAQQVRKYGDLQLALAAYNAGPSCVDSYGGIPPFAETQNYVASITSEYVRTRRKRRP